MWYIDRMQIINTTPHSVSVNSTIIPSSGMLVRVSSVSQDAGEFAGIPLVRTCYGEVVGLPDEQDGVMYIVSGLVRAALPDRKDLASPAKLIRNDKGEIIGCGALEIN